MISLRLGLQIVEHIPLVHALVSRTSLVHLAVLVLVAGSVVLKDALVEDGIAHAVEAFLGRSANPWRVFAWPTEEELCQGICEANGAFTLEVLEFSISDEATDSGDSTLLEASSLLLGSAF